MMGCVFENLLAIMLITVSVCAVYYQNNTIYLNKDIEIIDVPVKERMKDLENGILNMSMQVAHYEEVLEETEGRFQVLNDTLTNNHGEISDLFTRLNLLVSSICIPNYWEKLPDADFNARSASAASVHQDAIYVFGGSSGGSYASDLWKFNFTTEEWASIPSSSIVGRHTHTMVIYQDSLFVLGGGASGDTRRNDLMQFSIYGPSSWIQRATWSSVIYRHSAVVFEDAMYVFGGTTGQNYNTAMNVLSKYVFQDDTLSAIEQSDPPSHRGQHSAVVYRDSMFVYGGENENGVKNDLWQYSFRKNSWKEHAMSSNKPPLRNSHTSFIFRDALYIFAGLTSGSPNRLNDFWRYSIHTDKWEEVEVTSTPPNPRNNHLTFVYGDAIYMVSGLAISESSTTNTKDLWKLRCDSDYDNKLLPFRTEE